MARMTTTMMAILGDGHSYMIRIGLRRLRRVGVLNSLGRLRGWLRNNQSLSISGCSRLNIVRNTRLTLEEGFVLVSVHALMVEERKYQTKRR